ncbi:putative dinucleotide-binding enzyme [Cryobacterium sp. MP_M5]|uniref:NADPH-dependent F420 reductase n=1 Tax=unclassified Cryobacterium TaxID=2649013 RepID=UPI0018C8F2B0|nr:MULTISPECIES: NADPH-dependent F420 reductase [unclassified Cryobacterium]MBG6058195.1 putative dinucleotide-binding enzyme [Cryobacterium sp. MP_M3]MEC5176561.1 putative dinucleotide-binding enzyme [Cryobacterium sp. MP_M5]
MTSFTIIGTGNMGSAIGGLLAAGGSDVTHVTHEQLGAAPLTGDVVILAVPYSALEGILAAYSEQLAGKTVVDITNPLDFATFDSLVVPAGSSAAAQLQAKLPGSRVLKAFNTNFAATLASKTIGGLPTTVLVAGDDVDAKGALIAAVEAGGVSALDAGSLSRAHELEALGFLQLALAAGEKIAWTAGFAVVR